MHIRIKRHGTNPELQAAIGRNPARDEEVEVEDSLAQRLIDTQFAEAVESDPSENGQKAAPKENGDLENGTKAPTADSATQADSQAKSASGDRATPGKAGTSPTRSHAGEDQRKPSKKADR